MILVTGGTGLLGSHLLYTLVKNGEAPRAIKRRSSDLNEVKKVFSYYTKEVDKYFSKIEWIEADILEPESLDDVFENIKYVYHAAAFVSFDPKDYKNLIKNNQQGTANIVNACLQNKVEKLLHVSSTAAIGPGINGDPADEECIWSPEKSNTGYSVSKFKSEMEVWRGMEEGLAAVIVNPSIIFGPGYWDKGSSSMFTRLKRRLKYYTNGVTGYVWIEDVVKCMIFLMNSDIKGERFIINSENLSYREVFTMISNALEVKPPSREVTMFLGEIAWRLDSFRSLFGFKRVITKDAIQAGQNVSRFSNEKIKSLMGIEFRPVKEVVEEIVKKMP